MAITFHNFLLRKIQEKETFCYTKTKNLIYLDLYAYLARPIKTGTSGLANFVLDVAIHGGRPRWQLFRFGRDWLDRSLGFEHEALQTVPTLLTHALYIFHPL